PRHERYAQGLAAGKVQSIAYVDAGYKPSEPHASRLASDGKISGRVQEILGRAAHKAELSAQWVLERLVRVYNGSMEGQPILDRYGKPTGDKIRNFSGANKSLELIGKYEGIGMFVERKDVTHHNLKDMSDTDLDSFIARLKKDDIGDTVGNA
ncbi:hypothetical protein LCGC14_2283240, partial [marine sediment metagenome]